jgi:CheY-like chemotaxis protein
MQTFDSDSQRTALVVDYDPWERWFATKVLAGEGYFVVGASNGASGLRLVQQHRCDVILLDLALPELPGPDFLRQLRSIDATREIPVIVLGPPQDEPICGAEGSLPKPLDELRVLSEVGRVLDLPVELTTHRAGRPVVLVASEDEVVADRLVEHLQRIGSVACAARSEAGCLRVATAVGPDVVLLDSNLPSRLEGMLRAHPVSRTASIVRLPEQLRTRWSR